MDRGKKSIKIVLTVVALIYLSTRVFGQPVQLQFSYLTPEDGLSSSAVLSILQDHNGFMWIGTYDGANRFDGKNFKIYKNDPADPSSLPGDMIRAMYEDPDGNLFFGTTNGLSLYNPDTDHFTNFIEDTNSALYGIESTVYHIMGDSSGGLWISTNIGLIFFDPERNQSEIYTPDPDNPESLRNRWVEYTLIDSRGRFWVTTRQGIHLFIPETKTFKSITKGINPGETYANHSFLEIAEDQQGNIWFGSYDGLFRLESTSDDFRLKRYIHDPDDPHSISGNRLLCLLFDPKNNLWIGAENDGLYLYNPEKDNFWRYGINALDVSSLNNESVQDIYFDKTGNLWIATFGGGINLVPKNSEAIIHFKNLKGSELSLSNDLVSTFHEDSHGRIWIGTDGGGLNLFNPENKSFERIHMENSAISSNAILDIIEDQWYNLWMSTWAGGLVKYNPDKKQFTTFTTRNSEIPDNNLFSLVLTENNCLWIGSYRNGLIHYDIDKNKFTAFNENNSGIANNYVFKVVKNAKGNLYLGTTDGMDIYFPDENRFVNYSPDEGNPESLSNPMVYDILIENDTSVWIGTQNGLNRFNPETGIFRQFYVKDGLPDNVIKGLLFDQREKLWVTTNGGLCRFDPEENNITLFTREDGLQSNEFKHKSTLLSDSGNLYFGGVNGFNILYPDKIAKNMHIPDVLITGLNIFNTPMKPNTPGSPLKSAIYNANEITLSHKQTVLTFYFAVMDFTIPEKNQHAYMLENFDEDWIYCGNKREVTYTNLNPGEYILHVKGSNNNGIWNEKGTSLKIIIKPPWWETTLFKILLLVYIGGIIFLIFQMRTASLRKQKAMLSEKVNERTRNLNEKNILLERANTILRDNQKIIKSQTEELKATAENLEETNKKLASINATKDKLFSIIGHDLKNPFNVILGYTDLLLSNFNEWKPEQIKELIEQINKSSESACILLDNLLQWSKSQQGTLEFAPLSTEVGEIIDTVLEEVMPFANKKGVEIIPLFEDKKAKVNADINMLTCICRNLLMNAVKFSNTHDKVIINTKNYDARFILFSIKDEGTGMDEKTINDLFKLNKNSVARGTGGEKGTGLGLILCHEFVTMHEGKIWAESKANEGSTFFFTIPKA